MTDVQVTAPVMQHYYASLVNMHPNYTLAPMLEPLPTMFPAISRSSHAAS